MTRIEISSGRISALFRLLKALKAYSPVSEESLREFLLRNRTVPSVSLWDGAKLTGSRLRLISEADGELILTERGKNLLVGHEDDAGTSLKRRVLLMIITELRRDLMWIASVGKEQLTSIEPGIRDCLSELQLLRRKLSEDAEKFWADLRFAGSRINEELLKRIGDEAESWSMTFERERLAAEGRSDLAEKIQWLSRESDLHGYDILSFTIGNETNQKPLHIEVKKISQHEEGSHYFFFSRNEFEQASALSKEYLFHLWFLEPNTSAASLAVVKAGEVLSRVPVDSNGGGLWTQCIITFDTSLTSTVHHSVPWARVGGET
jgi:hypothetical protein